MYAGFTIMFGGSSKTAVVNLKNIESGDWWSNYITFNTNVTIDGRRIMYYQLKNHCVFSRQYYKLKNSQKFFTFKRSNVIFKKGRKMGALNYH